MQLWADVLLIIAGLFLMGNAAASLVAVRRIKQVQDNWWAGAVADRWGAGRIRVLLSANALASGLLGIAAMAVGVLMVLTR